MMVATDIGVLRWTPPELQILLVRRGSSPYLGRWVLPGGLVEPDEDLPDAAARELKEETDVTAPFLVEVGTFGRPDRDPRGRTISIAYYSAVTSARATAGDDAADAGWWSVGSLPELGFDHDEVARRVVERVREDLTRTHLAFALIETPFAVAEAARLVHAARALPPAFTTARIARRLRARARVKSLRNGYRLRVDPREPLTRPLRW
jgi:8-oxo-dGTP diphosphatase